MNNIDLHVHSNISDGTFSPSELVLLAQETNLSAFALTDHDTVSGIQEATNAAKNTNIEIIPGIEFSSAYKSKDIHILGYFVDYKNEEFLSKLVAAQKERDNRNKKMANNLNNIGIDISLEQLISMFPNAVITRAHFAKYLTTKGYTKDNQEAFDKYLDSNKPYYVSREYISPEGAIELIKRAGGIPVLAHPLLYKLPSVTLDALIKRLKENGLVGIETIYSSNIRSDEKTVRNIAKKYDLLMTGGSDFHGSNKPSISMGTGRGNLKIPHSLLEELKNYKMNH